MRFCITNFATTITSPFSSRILLLHIYLHSHPSFIRDVLCSHYREPICTYVHLVLCVCSCSPQTSPENTLRGVHFREGKGDCWYPSNTLMVYLSSCVYVRFKLFVRLSLFPIHGEKMSITQSSTTCYLREDGLDRCGHNTCAAPTSFSQTCPTYICTCMFIQTHVFTGWVQEICKFSHISCPISVGINGLVEGVAPSLQQLSLPILRGREGEGEGRGGEDWKRGRGRKVVAKILH